MIYLDHAATTATDKEVLEAMRPYFEQDFGNPNSHYELGYKPKIALDDAREKVANLMGFKSSEIIFTGSGSEANNLAILGFARANVQNGKHLITTQCEHSSVLAPFKQLEKEGFEVSYLEPDEFGQISPVNLKAKVRPETILISIIHANNEIGTIKDINALKEAAGEATFHTDACNSPTTLKLAVIKADMISVNGSKIYGPKGIGVLAKRDQLKLQPIIHGGHQEFELRAGTHNMPAIVGMAKALELVQKNAAAESARLTKMRDRLIAALSQIENSRLNGHPSSRLAGNLNFSFKDISGRALVMHLDQAGICASTGSACQERQSAPSHVLEAIKTPADYMEGTIRLSLGHSTNDEDIDTSIAELTKTLRLLRQSPHR